MLFPFYIILILQGFVVSSFNEYDLTGMSEDLEEIHIGGLFENLNSSGARAFEVAVNYVNEKGLLPGKRLVSEAHQVSSHDSFQVGKIVCEMVSGGVAAIFGPQSRETSYHVQSLCDTMEVPHLTARWDPAQRRSSCLLNLYPHPSVLSQAVQDIVSAWAWKGFTVIYDDYEALMKIQSLLKLADDKGYLVTVRQLKKVGEAGYRSVLKEIKYSEEKNLVIECSIDILYDVMIQAQQVGLVGADYSYIITSLDFHTIDYEPFMWSGTNITSIRLVSPENPQVKELSRIWEGTSTEPTWKDNRMEEEPEEDYGEEESGLRYLHHPLRYVQPTRKDVMDETSTLSPVSTSTEALSTEELSSGIFGLPLPTVESALVHDAVILLAKALQYLNVEITEPASCDLQTSLDFGYSVINFMKLSEFQGTSGVVKFDHEGFRTDIELEVIELTEAGLKKKGTWNKTLNIIHPEPDGPYSDDGEDLRNSTFVVLIALTHPYNMLKEDSKALKGNDRYEGFGVDLIHELSLMSGFNYTFKEHVDKNSGNPTELPNGTRVWNGLIGEVIARRADLAIADITITRERERDADFTHPFMNLGISILHRTPRKAPPSLFSFLDPFSSEVWAYTVSAYVGVSLLLFVMARISPYEWNNPYPCVEEPDALENQFSLINSFWFTVGSLMQQGSDIAPISSSTRMVASVWWFFTLIMVSSYTAQLASFLTIETIVQPFKDIEELANQDVIKYGAKKGGSTVNFFRDSKDPIHQKIYKFMEANPDCMMTNNDDGVKRVLAEPNYAFFMESTSIEYEVERKCDLAQVGGLIDNKGYGIVMKQNSTYRNILSRNVIKLQERGKLTQLKNKWWKEKRGGGACLDENKVSEASELNLDNTGGVFVVLLGGCMFAVFVAFCEVVWNVHSNENKISFKHELYEELKFILKFRGRVKPIRRPTTDFANCNNDEEKLKGSQSTYKSSFYIG